MNYSIYAESTPNPEVMKFVANRMLADKSIEISNIKDAKGISIAEELLKFPFVKSIYLSANFNLVANSPEVVTFTASAINFSSCNNVSVLA